MLQSITPRERKNMARLQVYIKLFVLALFTLSSSLVTAQDECSTTTHITRTVTEGDPGDLLVINVRNEYNYTSSSVLFFSTVLGQLHPSIFTTHFVQPTEEEIRTRHRIDRDAIAGDLGNTFAPVVFQVRIAAIRISTFTTRDCYELDLIVADINDNVPRFLNYENQPYPANLDEGDPHAEYAIVRATDVDEGENSTRSYMLVNNLGKFQLEVEMADNGRIIQVLLQLLDNVTLNYEEETSYNLTIIASEGNDNPSTATLQVSVAVIDACDESPFFPMSAYFPTVRENSPMHTRINANITAMDQDLIDRDRLRYLINDVCAHDSVNSDCEPITDHPFTLDRETGILTLTGDLDREEYEEYVVSVHVVDGCSRSATASIMIIVEDENDNYPEVEYNAGLREVSENSHLNTRIGFISVSDDDTGENARVIVELFDNSTGSFVSSQTFQLLNGSQGDLIIQSALDRETTDRYSLVVRVTDFGTPRLTTFFPLDITVTDYNDNPPVFDRDPIRSEYQVEENRPTNTLIVTLFANDSDIGGNGMVSYHLPASNSTFPHQHLFSIDELGGNLKVAGTLDREQVERIQVLVVARDNPTSETSDGPQLSDQVIINIRLIDLNDNTPSMITPSGTINVREDHTPDSFVFQVQATDPDTPTYSTLHYSFAPNSSPFDIDPNTGSVALSNTGLDYDRQAQSYNLEIRVSDGNNTGVAPLTIIVTDVNDEKPEFSLPPLYMPLVNESEAANHPVVGVSATDIDTPTADLRFSISNGNDQGHFHIDPQTGHISTTVTLNREETAQYNLTVRVFDGIHYAEQDAFVGITVIDINDNIPYFDGAPYTFPFEENLPQGSLVDTVHAIDPDAGRNGEVRYNIMQTFPPGATGWFSLNSESGELTTTRVLDRESPVLAASTDSEVTLQIGARDLNSETSNITTVTVTIVDRNDQPPRFEEPLVVQDLTENFPRGSTFLTVRAVDNDLPPFNSTTYSISELFPPGITELFRIEPTTGELSLLATLDYETQQQHNFTVIARDVHQGSFQATQMVTINVLNARELNLKCDNFFPLANVTEHSPLNHPIIVFECTDLQGASVDQVEYNLTNLDGTPSSYFGIREDSINGRRPATVYTLSNIDRDTLPKQANGAVQITVVITARDPNTSENSFGSINSTLTITVLDINDHPPRFAREFYNFGIDENNAANSLLDVVAANDSDNGVNGTITYSIQTVSVPFTIDTSSGEIFASQVLDREASAFYEFVVVASDGGNPPLQDVVNVRVNVNDLNDNSPEFDSSQNRTIVVGEEVSVGTVVTTLIVADADSDMFGPVTIEIAPGSSLDTHFALYANGSLVLQRELDREMEEFYSFTARARDGPGNARSAAFNIFVGDYNDNPPIFRAGQRTEVTIREDHPLLSHVVITASADDADTGRNGEIRYVLADQSLARTFCIDVMTGDIRLCSQHGSCPDDEIVDFERQPRYDVTVIAYDLGSPRHIVNKTVTIIISNVNEHPPVFDQGEVIAYVDENQPNEVVARLRAYDWDYDDLTYEVLENREISSEFRYENGAILANRRLDYATNPFYMLTLRALETAGTRNGSIEVELFVNNINDHPPVFDVHDYPTSALIPESTELETVVLTVHADDADNNTHDAVSYSIVSGNTNGCFKIDSLFGDISVNKSLDFDSITEYLLTVQAIDTGVPTQTATVQVSIRLINENDEIPVFNATEYSFSIMENSQTGTVVGSVYATDRDVGSFGSVRYSFLQDNPYFTVNQVTGAISSRVDIDREEYVTQPENTNPISFLVTATDQGLSESRTATVSVAVAILDVNDNTPMFSQDQYIISIPPSQPANTTIETIVATDSDLGQYAIPTYQITTLPPGISAEVSSSTGDLFLTQPLPGNYQPQYDLVIRATDSDDSSKFSEARVRLVVETSADHHPRFDMLGTYAVEIIENTPTGRSVFDVSEHVSDEDSDSVPSGQLSYAFEQEYPKFAIDPSSGLITLAQSLDFEAVSEYTLTVLASDNTPAGARTATAILTVSVTGFNDFSPVFVNLPNRITLSPVSFLNVKLFTLVATDDDHGVEGEVEYSLVEANQLFTVDSETGIVRNQGVLQDGDTFVVEVGAFDRGSPYRSSNATVMVNIVNPAANAPSFPGVSGTVTLSLGEDTEIGTAFAPAFVTLPAAQTYQIVRHNGTDGTFVISQSQGQLTLKNSLNHRLESQYQLIVEALIENRDTSNNVVRYSSFVQVDIVVNDVNDNPPQFLYTPTLQTISESREVNSVPLFTVTATDNDSGLNGQINYEFIGGNTERVFNIDPTSGDVTLAHSLDWETQRSYELTIRAFDLSNQPKTAVIIVPITIEDVNDYVPSFLGNYTVGVYEYPHTHMGDPIIKLAATDLDEGPPLRYTLDLLEARFGNEVRSASQDTFTINTDTGAVSVGRRMNIDRERIDYYHFRVTVTDQVHTVTTYLTINVLDVNDHSPVLSLNDRDPIEIPERQPSGTLVTSGLSYTDGDIGINSWAQYSLGDDWPEGGYFKIDPNTGVIRIDNSIVNNPMLNNNEYMFEGTVHVTDQGIPPRRTSMRFDVLITDVNDNAPVFEQSSHVIPISINRDPGETFYSFNVSDPDFIQNGAYTTKIPSYYDDAHNSFQLDSMGNLSVKNHGQLEIRNYTFRVEASTPSFDPDCAQYMTASYADVTVVVLPENTACPPFANEVFAFSVFEEGSSQQLLDTLTATDPDGDNVRYSISSLDSDRSAPFEINEESGAFSVTTSLDRETQDYYEFTIFATDDGFPSRSCSSIVRVTVVDINDNAPVFSNTEYEGSIVENSMTGGPIVTVNATDADSGSFGEVEYSLVVDENITPFQIDRQSGEISALRALNCEASNSYNFPVVASDKGDPATESTASVTIHVTGVEEFAPEFEQESYEFYISPDAQSGDKIGSVRAIDLDECNHGVLVYSFVNAQPSDYFRIDNTTGSIYLIIDPVSAATNSPTQGTVAVKRQVNLQDYFEVVAIVRATDGFMSDTVEVSLFVHNSFVTIPRNSEPFEFQIIAIVVAAVIACITVFVIVLITTLVCRKRRQSGSGKINDSGDLNNGIEMGSRFSSRRSQNVYTPQYKQTGLNHLPPEHTTLNHSSGSGSNSNRDSYTADDEMDSINGHGMAYGSPGLTGKTPNKVSPRARSTSDLASSIGTEALTGESQDTTVPYSKAQIAAIYAANVGLLTNSSSHDSIHMFGSEGGGEDGDVDISNMLFAKYNDLEDDDDEDDSTTLPDEDDTYRGSKIRRSMSSSAGNVNVPTVEEQLHPFPYGRNTNGWMPQVRPMDDTINEIANYDIDDRMLRREPYAGPYAHSNSQGTSIYEASTQGSRTSLLRHHTGSHSQQLRQPMHIPPMMSSQEYGEYRDYNPPPPMGRNVRHPGSRDKRYGSANALSRVSDYHARDIHPPRREHMHVNVEGSDFSQEMNPPYHHPYHPHHAMRTQSPTTSTPTDGTVTPQRAMDPEYDPNYLSSASSTSLGSTNFSSTHDQGSIDPRQRINYH